MNVQISLRVFSFLVQLSGTLAQVATDFSVIPSACGGCFVQADFTTARFTAINFNNTSLTTTTTLTNSSLITNRTSLSSYSPIEVTSNTLLPIITSIVTEGTSPPIVVVVTAVSTNVPKIIPYLRATGTASGSPTIWIVITAYSITSTVYTHGSCAAFEDIQPSFSPGISVGVPPGLEATVYETLAEEEFVTSILGLPTCMGGRANITPNPSTTFFPSINTSLSSTSLIPTTAASLGLASGAKAGIAVAASISLLTLCLWIAYLWRRHRISLDQEIREELDSEEQTEMYGDDMRYEVHGDGENHELPVLERSQELLGDEQRHELPALVKRHELVA